VRKEEKQGKKNKREKRERKEIHSILQKFNTEKQGIE
jgi:hypothetical protein